MARPLILPVLLLTAAVVVACARETGAPRGDAARPVTAQPPPTPAAQAQPQAQAQAQPDAAPAPKFRKRQRTAPPKPPRFVTGREKWSELSDLNPFFDGSLILVAPDDSCFYESIQGAPSESPVDPWHDEPVDCPAALDHPVWDDCIEGRLQGERGGAQCRCTGRKGKGAWIVGCPPK